MSVVIISDEFSQRSQEFSGERGILISAVSEGSRLSKASCRKLCWE